jgi:hypothetical protein
MLGLTLAWPSVATAPLAPSLWVLGQGVGACSVETTSHVSIVSWLQALRFALSLLPTQYFVALLGSDNAARVKGGGHVRERERSHSTGTHVSHPSQCTCCRGIVYGYICSRALLMAISGFANGVLFTLCKDGATGARGTMLC